MDNTPSGLPAVNHQPRSDSALKILVYRLRCEKGTLFRLFKQLRIIATRSTRIRSPRVEHSIFERLAPSPSVHLSETVCTPNRTRRQTDYRPHPWVNHIRLIVPSLPGILQVEVKCLTATLGWRCRCLGIKLEVHGLSTSQVPKHSLISRTLSPTHSFFSLFQTTQ